MSLYSKHILPRVVDCGCRGQAFEKQRRRIVPNAKGVVLDLGVGTGLNVPHYDASQVTKVIGLDPCRTSLEMAKTLVANSEIPFEFIHGIGEDLPLDDQSVDTVILTYTLCTVQDVEAVLSEVSRILRADGQILFCEHVAAPTPRISRLQRLVSRPWAFLLGGCQLNRRAATALRRAKFCVVAETEKLRGMPLPIAWQTTGSARPLRPGERPDRCPTGPDLNLSI